MSIDPFLAKIAVQNSIQSALQRNEIYVPGCSDRDRANFVRELTEELRQEAKHYDESVAEGEHCDSIQRICEALSARCGGSLKNGRFRFGTAQKAFNLYLKFLWKLGEVAMPPHCPFDGVVLAVANIKGASWTNSDSKDEYLGWVSQVKMMAGRRSIAEWEDQIWMDKDKGVP